MSTELVWPLTIEIPWPNAELNPNSRVFWMTKSRIAKRYRVAAARATALALVGRRGLRHALAGVDPVTQEPPAVPPLVHVGITFHPPDRRSRDWDNMLSSIKAGLDGLAKGAIDRDGFAVPGLPGLGIDDRYFRPMLDLGPVRKKGAVVFRVRPFVRVCPTCGLERLGLDLGQDRPGSLLD